MTKSILYRNKPGDLLLMDLSTSIQEAQSSKCQLGSVEPTRHPYPSTEPRGDKKEKMLNLLPPHQLEFDTELRNVLENALKEVKAHVDGTDTPWVLPRCTSVAAEPQTIKANMKSRHIGSAEDFGTRTMFTSSSESPPIILSSTDAINHFSRVDNFRNVAVLNPRSETSLVVIEGQKNYLIPPRSVFILSGLDQALKNFEIALRSLPVRQPAGMNTGIFDLILMDPPWSNRSARHAKTYATAETQSGDPFPETIPILQKTLKSDGIVGVWITNKVKVRSQVFQQMQHLGLSLYEEWIWLKTTACGEPVTSLNGVWRKPYEILLLFSFFGAKDEARRRIIVAVSDIHSRKPSLKEQLEELLPQNYQALELFARYLTAGWWSWGNEVLMFQSEDHWQIKQI